MDYRFRPIDTWPGKLTPEDARRRSPFDSPYDSTLSLLDRELGHLHAHSIVLQLALTEKDIRLDGLPKAKSIPVHPGIVLAFDSMHGPLKYATDIFRNGYNTRHSGWHANLRAIALALEALRKVDRYGITKRGEQYTGWKELGTGTPMMGGGEMNEEEAIAYLDSLVPSTTEFAWDADNPEHLRRVRKKAAAIVHPDHGGTPEDWAAMEHAVTVLQRALA